MAVPGSKERSLTSSLEFRSPCAWLCSVVPPHRQSGQRPASSLATPLEICSVAGEPPKSAHTINYSTAAQLCCDHSFVLNPRPACTLVKLPSIWWSLLASWLPLFCEGSPCPFPSLPLNQMTFAATVAPKCQSTCFLRIPNLHSRPLSSLCTRV